MYLVFDVETTGLPKNYKLGYKDTDNWPRMVEIAWTVLDKNFDIVKSKGCLIKPKGFTIPQEAIDIHGIDNDQALSEGLSIDVVIDEFNDDLVENKCKFIVGHNIYFDKRVLGCEMHRLGLDLELFKSLKQICTMNSSISLCNLKQANSNRAKYPNLSELHEFLFKEKTENCHQAEDDVKATVRCFKELVKLNRIKECLSE